MGAEAEAPGVFRGFGFTQIPSAAAGEGKGLSSGRYGVGSVG